MFRRRAIRVRAGFVAAWLATCVSGAGASAWAEDPTTTSTSTATTAPPNETKILLREPAPEAILLRERAPEAPPAASTPTTTIRATPTTRTTRPPDPAVRTDFAAVRAAAEASAEQRRRLGAEIADLEPRLAATEAGLVAAQDELSARRGEVETIERRMAATAADLEQADAALIRLELSAASAADAVAGRRTPVARPPAPGRTPADLAAQARDAVAAAVDRRRELVRALADHDRQLEVARQSTGGASSELEARAAELQRGRDVLAELRSQLVAAEQAAPGADAGGPGQVTLVPPPTALATATIPAAYLSLYGRAAATCVGLPWTVVAAVGAVESAHGQSSATGVRSGENFAGAMGPMQFLAGTWAAYGVDADGDGVRDVYNPADAVFGAANYLCASGAGDITTLRGALWNYNHADWYVDLVLELAARY